MKFSTTYKDFEIVFEGCNEKYIVYDKDGNVINEVKTEEDILKYLNEYIYNMYPDTAGNRERLNRTIWILGKIRILHNQLKFKTED